MIESPSLHLVQAKADELDREGHDIHTISLVLNGQHGGWDLTIESTDESLNDFRHEFILDRLGLDLHEGALT